MPRLFCKSYKLVPLLLEITKRRKKYFYKLLNPTDELPKQGGRLDDLEAFLSIFLVQDTGGGQ